jgi:hypothetical protein
MAADRNIDLESYPTLSSGEKLKLLVTLANLAPSSHNMQPWLFRIEDESIVLLPNPKLRLMVADPDGREFFITLGTVIGSMKLVARAYGLGFEYSKSNNIDREIGRFRFTSLEAVKPDYELLKAFVQRHNSRLPFSKNPLPEKFIEKIRNALAGIADFTIIIDEELKGRIERNILDSVKDAFADKNFCLELAPWVKKSIGRHEDGLPGYNLGMPFLLSLIFPWMIRNIDISNLQVKIHKRMLDNSSVYGVISANEETSEKWLEIGEAFLNVAVEAEKDQISIGIMQASIENAKNRKELQNIIGSEKLPQMFFRLGYCNLNHKHSPRRPLSKVLTI